MAPQRTYLVDHACYKPPEELVIDRMRCMQIMRDEKWFRDDEIDFMVKIAEKSGLGLKNTYLPKALHPHYCGGRPQTDMASAAVECKMVIYGAMEALLAKTGLQVKDIDILVTTCSIFCPTPSMASMLVNKFKMRSDLQSYHLGGMGCANGVVAVNLINDLLKARPNSNAVLVTTEVTTPAYYQGHDKHRQVTNVLFRMGAAAMLFTNKPAAWGDRVKYRLHHNVRVHVGASDDALQAIDYRPDEDGVNGIYLGKNVVTEASRALTKAMWIVGPHVMTWGQIATFVANRAARALAGAKALELWTPKFSEGVRFFLIHAGGAKVLDGIGKALQLTEEHLEPSRAVLHDYGNVSSSTTWYTLAYVETAHGVRRGEKVLQVGVGSGIKCGVNVWRALRDVRDVHHVWEHRLAPEEAAALKQSLSVRYSRGWVHTAQRALFFALMLLMLAALLQGWLVPLLGSAGGVAGSVRSNNTSSVVAREF